MLDARQLFLCALTLTLSGLVEGATWCHDYTLYRVSDRSNDYTNTTPDQLRAALRAAGFEQTYFSDTLASRNRETIRTVQGSLRRGDVVIFGDKHSGYVNDSGRIDHMVQKRGETGKARSLEELRAMEAAPADAQVMLKMNWSLEDIVYYSYPNDDATATITPYQDQFIQVWRRPSFVTRWTLVRIILDRGSHTDTLTLSGSGLQARTKASETRYYKHVVDCSWDELPKTLAPGASVTITVKGTAREVETKNREPIGFGVGMTWEAGGAVPTTDLNDDTGWKKWRWNGSARFVVADGQKGPSIGFAPPGDGYKKAERPGQATIRVPAQTRLTDQPQYANITMIIWNWGSVIWIYRADGDPAPPAVVSDAHPQPGTSSVGALDTTGQPVRVVSAGSDGGGFPAADWLGVMANAAEPGAGALESRRVLLFRHKVRNAAGMSARDAIVLAREFEEFSKRLARAGKLAGFLDSGLNLVEVTERIYVRDGVGVVETGTNAYLSGVVTAWGAEKGASVGFLIGGSLGGPPGALIGGAVGGAAGAFGSSYAYDVIGKHNVGRIAAFARDPGGQVAAADRFLKGLWSVYWRAYDLGNARERTSAQRLAGQIIYSLDSCKGLLDGGGKTEDAADLRQRAASLLK